MSDDTTREAIGRAAPILALAAAGAVGALLIARAGGVERAVPAVRRAARDAGRRLDALGDNVGEHLDEVSGRVLDALPTPRTRDSLPERIRDALPASVRIDSPEALHEALPADPSPLDRVRRAAASIGIDEKGIALLLVTFIGRSLAELFRWRSERQSSTHSYAEAHARADTRDDTEAGSGTASGAAAPRPLEERLQARTVAELREVAAVLDIAGRSAMNKEELVAALVEHR